LAFVSIVARSARLAVGSPDSIGGTGLAADVEKSVGIDAQIEKFARGAIAAIDKIDRSAVKDLGPSVSPNTMNELKTLVSLAGPSMAKARGIDKDAIAAAKHVNSDASLYAASHKAPIDQQATQLLSQAAAHAANVEIIVDDQLSSIEQLEAPVNAHVQGYLKTNALQLQAEFRKDLRRLDAAKSDLKKIANEQAATMRDEVAAERKAVMLVEGPRTTQKQH
jgi:hypothetical protein